MTDEPSIETELEPPVDLSPEQDMWLHCLYMAIYDASKAKDDALKWIYKPGRRSQPRTFNWVCHMLGLDPEQTRFIITERIHSNVDIRKWL